MPSWSVHKTCHFRLTDDRLTHPTPSGCAPIAAFDVDWTLAYGECHLFPRLAHDIRLLPQRLCKLKALHDKGYVLVAFTNQSSRSTKEDLEKRARMDTLLARLQDHDIPMSLFMATRKDTYRKPDKGMWDVMLDVTGVAVDWKRSFFCGDALGRPGDFSDSDKQFGCAIGLEVVSPETLFGTFDPEASLVPHLALPKTLVLFVGAPGTGKTTFFRNVLEPRGFVHIHQDTLKTKTKVMSMLASSLKEGRPVCLDATHPKQRDRDVYYHHALDKGYTLITLYFTRDGRRWNGLRDASSRVPTMAYHMFFKHLNPPRADTTPGILLCVY